MGFFEKTDLLTALSARYMIVSNNFFAAQFVQVVFFIKELRSYDVESNPPHRVNSFTNEEREFLLLLRSVTRVQEKSGNKIWSNNGSADETTRQCPLGHGPPFFRPNALYYYILYKISPRTLHKKSPLSRSGSHHKLCPHQS